MKHCSRTKLLNESQCQHDESRYLEALLWSTFTGARAYRLYLHHRGHTAQSAKRKTLRAGTNHRNFEEGVECITHEFNNDTAGVTNAPASRQHGAGLDNAQPECDYTAGNTNITHPLHIRIQARSLWHGNGYGTSGIHIVHHNSSSLPVDTFSSCCSSNL